MTIKVGSRYKEKIAGSFGQAVGTYNAHAKLQRYCAERLLSLVTSYQTALPKGCILEIGCGTGFITQGLIQRFPQRYLEITDLSSEMLQFCQAQFAIPIDQQQRISFYQMDGENHLNLTQAYAAIVSGFVLQWFEDPVRSISQLVNQLHPDGILFVSFPTCQSFPEWRQICRRLNLPFTANRLPDLKPLLQAIPIQAHLCHVETIEQVTTHANATEFFRDLKAIGAGINQTNQSLSIRQMKQLVEYWDASASSRVSVHHQVAFLAIQRHSQSHSF